MNLTFDDLNVMKKIIIAGSQRGTFKPEELAIVGSLYLKIENILQLQTQDTSKTQGEQNA